MAYLQGLPRGLQSYPECLVLAEVCECTVQTLAPVVVSDTLPEPLRNLITGSGQDKWRSEVVLNAALLMLRDVMLASDEAFTQWTYDDVRRIFSRPAFRVLMALLSPSLVAMGSAKRWSTFHQGSSLGVERLSAAAGRSGTKGVLKYPAGFYSGLLITRQTQSFVAAVNLTGAKNARVEVKESGPTETLFVASWDA